MKHNDLFVNQFNIKNIKGKKFVATLILDKAH